MSVKVNHNGTVSILELSGKLMGGEETNEVRDEIQKLVAANHKHFVFDLGNIKWMNSSGLGVIVNCHNIIKEAGGELKLARVEEKIESLLIVTHLIKVFKTYSSIDAAIESF